MSCDGLTMKVYPPKCSSGTKASDRLQEYLMQSNPGNIMSPQLRSSKPDSSPVRGLRAADAALASVEAALIDNHVHAQPQSLHSATSYQPSQVLPVSRATQLPTKEKWKKFALDVLTCIPQRDQDQACEGFLEAMRDIMSQSSLKEPSSQSVRNSRFADKSGLNAHSSSWDHEPAPSVSSAFFNESHLEKDLMPRLEELFQMLHSPR
jgi:hypothetical protein